jgi:hypothetical protein
VVVLGVHTPETPGEAKAERVRQQVKANAIAYPVALDPKGRTWAVWGNRYWPSTYLIDKRGVVRYRWDGELNLGQVRGEKVMRRKIEELLAEKD